MNSIWSDCIQGAETLYRSRALRFGNRFFVEYKKAFGIDGCGKILEIGCGPGALAVSLARMYKGAEITAVDRDAGFIEYAGQRAPDICFMTGDAEKLPFEDGSFDVTISNTVAEHVEPSAFYKEQYRVLKENGVCLVISSRKSVSAKAPCVAFETEFEKSIWEKTAKAHEELFEKYKVGAYAQSEAEIPLNMEKYGFGDISVNYIAVDLTPDDPKNSAETAHAMIDSERYNDLESADALIKFASGSVTEGEITELKRLINEKYDRRTALYDAGIRQWDTVTSLVMIVKGVKK
ncbi:MAG: class I SAM-dependent methyltransferase [Clostridia bacterium]|nr:class I SAM-dependent methyltransferase [Clostridia bacterium]